MATDYVFSDALNVSKFTEVAVLEDLDGVGLRARITSRPMGDHTVFSVAFFREFHRGAEPQVTSFFQRRHLVALRRLLDDADQRLALEEDKIRTARRRAP